MFFGCSSATFSVKTSFLMCVVHCLALEFGGPLARLLQVGTSFHVQDPAIVDLPESSLKFAQKLLYSLEAATMLSHVAPISSCRRSRSFWALSSSSIGLVGKSEQHVTSSISCVTFFMVSSKISYSSAKTSRACTVFWLRSKTSVFASAFLFYIEELRLPFRQGGAAVPHTASFPLPQKPQRSRSGAFTFGSGAVSPPSSVPASPARFCPVPPSRHLQCHGGVLCSSLVPSDSGCFVISRISTRAPPTPSRMTAFRGLVLVRGW